LRAVREQSEGQMAYGFRLGATWVFTFILCGVLISAAYWHLH